MNRFMIAGIAFVVLIAAGVTALFFLGKPRTEELRSELDKVIAGGSDPLRKMQSSFDAHPYLLGAILTNRDGEITGSLYESSRIPELEFSIIKEETRINKNEMAAKLKTRGMSALRYQNPSYAGEIIMIINKRLTPVTTLKSIRARNETLFLGMIAVFSALFIVIAVILIMTFRKPEKEALKNKLIRETVEKRNIAGSTSARETSPNKTTLSQDKPVVIKPRATEPLQMLPIENVLSLFLGDLVSNAKIKAATLYRYRNGKPGTEGEWVPRIQRQGALTVTGNSLKERDLPSEDEIAEGLPVLDGQGTKLFIPLMNQEVLWGGILLQARSNATIDPSLARDFTEEVKRFSRNLYEHESFASAVFDTDTGFRSSPLFPIYLKEKMMHAAIFHVAIFELTGLASRSPDSLQTWGRALGLWLNNNGLSTENVFRLSQERFVIFYSKESTGPELKSEIRKLSMLHLGIDPVGAFLPRNSELEGTENFMRRLEKAVRIARREGGFRAHDVTWHTPVA